jgi:cytosine/adenosine deaminase-related metal-dependent hydrolase
VADLIIKNGTVLTMDKERRILENGAVVITDSRITAIGTTGEILSKHSAVKTIDAAGKLVMPGFVNAHTHVIQVLLRGGLSQDRELYDWLFNVLYPGLEQYTADEARLAATLYYTEAIRAGITTIVDNADQGKSDDIASATIGTYAELGIRAVYARMFFDSAPQHLDKLVETVMRKGPTVKHAKNLFEPTDDALAHIESLMRRFHNTQDGRIQVWPAPGLPNTTTEIGLMRAVELAEKYNTMITLHLAEAPLDSNMHGMTSTEYLNAIGFLSPRLLAAHCVWMNDRDLRLLKFHDVKVAHNSISNLYLASGFAPISKMISQGITVGVSTDDANCNDTVNMILAMKVAALAQRGHNLDSSALTTEKVLEMATIDAAKTIGMEHEIGSLEPGKKADVIVIGLNQAQMLPNHHIPSVLVFQAYGSEIETVVVDGKILMENRALTCLDSSQEQNLYKEAQQASRSIALKGGLTGLNREWRSLGS